MKKSLFDFDEETIYKPVSINKSNLELFKEYYKLMMYSGECDPAYPAMNYVADRLELNMNQRHWLAFLYSNTYNLPSAYWIFNEFPDPENVDINRFKRWVVNNRGVRRITTLEEVGDFSKLKPDSPKIILQKDRNQALLTSKETPLENHNFVKCVESYLRAVGNNPVNVITKLVVKDDITKTYNNIYNWSRNNIYSFGEFALFIYIESLNEITDIKTIPNIIDFRKGSKQLINGICKAYDIETTVNNKSLQEKLSQLKTELEAENKDINVNYWNIETVLCAFGKLYRGNDKGRYFGYYIDRMQAEILLMELLVPEGVDWSLLWDFRQEYFNNKLLGEIGGWKGIRKERMVLFNKTKRFISDKILLDAITKQYKRKQKFEIIGDVYDK